MKSFEYLIDSVITTILYYEKIKYYEIIYLRCRRYYNINNIRKAYIFINFYQQANVWRIYEKLSQICSMYSNTHKKVSYFLRYSKITNVWISKILYFTLHNFQIFSRENQMMISCHWKTLKIFIFIKNDA